MGILDKLLGRKKPQADSARQAQGQTLQTDEQKADMRSRMEAEMQGSKDSRQERVDAAEAAKEAETKQD
jgi:hypothetical protein